MPLTDKLDSETRSRPGEWYIAAPDLPSNSRCNFLRLPGNPAIEADFGIRNFGPLSPVRRFWPEAAS